MTDKTKKAMKLVERYTISTNFDDKTRLCEALARLNISMEETYERYGNRWLVIWRGLDRWRRYNLTLHKWEDRDLEILRRDIVASRGEYGETFKTRLTAQGWQLGEADKNGLVEIKTGGQLFARFDVNKSTWIFDEAMTRNYVEAIEKWNLESEEATNRDDFGEASFATSKAEDHQRELEAAGITLDYSEQGDKITVERNGAAWQYFYVENWKWTRASNNRRKVATF